MTTHGYSGTPLPKKLGIREGHRLAVLFDPGFLAELVSPLPAGLVDNKVCAVDEDWSGLRFVHRREDRP